MLQKSSSNNRQVQRTRSWIFEALMALMDEKPYDKITISGITEKAGVARQTFYRNYDGKDDVIYEYARNTMDTKFLDIEKNRDYKKQDAIILAFNVPAVCDVLPARIRALRSILSEGKATRADKMWRSNGVGMERSGMA
jgi:AcrR family transcriptional regulator